MTSHAAADTVQTEERSFRLWAAALLAAHVLLAGRLALGVRAWMIDEQNHASFAVWIAEKGPWLVDLDAVQRLADDWSGWIDWTLGINHPHFYYWLMALVATPFDGYPQQILAMRLANVVLSAATILVTIMVARRLPLAPASRLLFVGLVVLMPWLGALGSHVTNDNLAILGGAILVWGAVRLLGDGPSLGAWGLAALGLLLAGATKANALLLTGLLAAMLLAVMLWRDPRQWRAPGPWLFCAAGLLALLPYAYFTLRYGSPIPQTRGIHEATEYWLGVTGWGSIRLSSWEFFVYFWQKMFGTWNPFVTERTNTVLPEEWPLRLLPLVPVLATGLAAAHMLRSAAGLARGRGRDDTLVWLSVLGGIALIISWAAHYWLAYQNHMRIGWLNAIWPRYYMPVMLLPALSTAALVDLLVPAGRRQHVVLGCLALLMLTWLAR